MKKLDLRQRWLDAQQAVYGCGSMNTEIFVGQAARLSEARKLTGKLLDTHTTAIVFPETENSDHVARAVDWVGDQMNMHRLPRAFRNIAEMRDQMANFLKDITLNPQQPDIETHAKILVQDIEEQSQILSGIFAFESGFNLEFVKFKLDEPVWHVDHSVQTIPHKGFVRAVRVAHPQGSWVALKEATQQSRTVNDDGRASIKYKVNEYAEAGPGLYILRGDNIHSSAVVTDGKPRTVYTLTPHKFLHRDSLKNL